MKYYALTGIIMESMCIMEMLEYVIFITLLFLI